MKSRSILATWLALLLFLASLLDYAVRMGAQPAVPVPGVPPPPGGVPPPPGQPGEPPDPEEDRLKAEAKKKKKEEEERKAAEAKKKQEEAEAKMLRERIASAKVAKVLAAGGDPLGQYNLAVMYSEGVGVPLDYSEAFKWYQRSARQWHAEAQYALGSAHYIGRGTTKNKIEAYAWWNLAAAQGNKAARLDREKLAQEMTQDQIAIAQRITRGYILEKEEGERFPKPGQKKVPAAREPVPEPVAAPAPPVPPK